MAAGSRRRSERTLGVGFSLFFGACVAIIPWWGISGLRLSRHHTWLENPCPADVYKRNDLYPITDTFPRAEYCAYKKATFSGTEIVKYRVTSTGEMIIWSTLLVVIVTAVIIGLAVIIAGIVGSIATLSRHVRGRSRRTPHARPGDAHLADDLMESVSPNDARGP